MKRSSSAFFDSNSLIVSLCFASKRLRSVSSCSAFALDSSIFVSVWLIKKVDVSKDLPIVNGDRPRLVEVLQNLIDNAAKFTADQPDPQIEIGVHGANGEKVFFVKDNGIGIEPAYHERIFGLFDKLNPKSEGTGVGLALVKRIIEVHGGRIWVESEGKGQGSTFYFTLSIAG